MKTHGQRYQRCFSMKYSLVTMKPNIVRKSFHSEILNQNFRIFVSMKAKRCIAKKGSLDNYLLNTKPHHIDSKFGLYLRSLMIRKQKEPSFHVPYIVGSARQEKTYKRQYWDYHNIPSVFVPVNVR